MWPVVQGMGVVDKDHYEHYQLTHYQGLDADWSHPVDLNIIEIELPS